MTPEYALGLIGAVSGLLGAVTGTVSLGWQIRVQRRGGRHVVVTCSYMVPVYGPADSPEFRDDDQVSIAAINRGTAPVTVINYGVAIGPRGTDRNLFVKERLGWATRLPFVLEPGGEPANLLVPVADLRRIQSEQSVPFDRMRPWVELGDGRRVFARTCVPLK